MTSLGKVMLPFTLPVALVLWSASTWAIPCAGSVPACGGVCRGPGAFVCTSTSDPDRAACSCVPYDLTGAWMAQDGALYYLRQTSDGDLWWAGMSQESHQPVPGRTPVDFQQGLLFSNVFHGHIDGNTILGYMEELHRGLG